MYLQAATLEAKVQHPPRPFGVTLAIIASLVLFTIIPLAEVTMLLMVRLHFSRVTFTNPEDLPFAIGTDLLGIPDSRLILQAVIAIVFLIIAFFAWRGRPAFMRYVLMLSCICLTLYNVLSVFLVQLNQNNFEGGISSLDSILNSLSFGQFAIGLLVSFYVIWYLNRGPARAFYRGYYLPSPAVNPQSPVVVGEK